MSVCVYMSVCVCVCVCMCVCVCVCVVGEQDVHIHGIEKWCSYTRHTVSNSPARTREGFV